MPTMHLPYTSAVVHMGQPHNYCSAVKTHDCSVVATALIYAVCQHQALIELPKAVQ